MKIERVYGLKLLAEVPRGTVFEYADMVFMKTDISVVCLETGCTHTIPRTYMVQPLLARLVVGEMEEPK